MASSLVTSWQIDGETMETVRNFVVFGSKITANGNCSRGIKRCLLLGRKAMANVGSVLKSRDITLPTKICLVKAMVFPLVMYGLDYCDIEWFAFETNKDHSVIFEIASKSAFQTLLLTMMATPFLLRDSCPQS